MRRLTRVLRIQRIVVCLILGAVLTGLHPGGARAGEWAQISCKNPNGSSAPSEGWSTSGSSDLVYPATANNSCNATTPMDAVLPQSTTGAQGGETLTYTPPSGSSLAGGTLAVQLSADGYGSQTAPTSSGAALVLSPQYSTNDEVETCAEWSNGCWAGEASGSGGLSDFTGTVTLPSNAGGTVTVTAACLNEPGAPNCDKGGTHGVWAGAWVSSADLLLVSNAVPTATDFTGTILDPNARGTAQLAFTAAESDGPGVENVTVDIDGHPVYSATPNANNGECVSQGTYPGTSAAEFDNAQPCPSSVAVSIPINTQGLSDGTHELAVAVTDAAGNQATVLSRYISTRNPITTPAPRASHGRPLRVRFVLSARWRGSDTRLLSLDASGLPHDATLLASDSGPRHPRIRPSREPAARAHDLLAALTRLTFHAGDRLVLRVSAPGRRSERIALTIRDGRVPAASLL